MSITLQTSPQLLAYLRGQVMEASTAPDMLLHPATINALVADAQAAHQLHALINNPHTDEFLQAMRLETAHQRDRWGEAHNRDKSAEAWFWLVGFLAGKCLRAVITGDRAKALHHAISSAAALANWHEAIKKDKTDAGLGQDKDICPIQSSQPEGGKETP